MRMRITNSRDIYKHEPLNVDLKKLDQIILYVIMISSFTNELNSYGKLKKTMENNMVSKIA